MIHDRLLVVAFSFLALVAAGISFGTNAAIALEPESFLREYRPAAAKLEQFYSNCKISAMQTTVSTRGLTTKHRMLFAGGAGKYKTSVTMLECPDPKLIDAEIVAVAGESGGIVLARAPRAEKYVTERTPPDREAMLKAMRGLLPVFGPYCFQRQRIVDFMAEATFKFRGIDEHVKDQDGLVKVFWESPAEDEQDGKAIKVSRTGWFVFDRKASWALRESTVVIGTTSQPVVHIDKVEMKYAGKDRDIPLVSGCRSSNEQPGEHPSNFLIRWTTSFEDVRIEPGEAPAGDFDLGRYGVTDVHIFGQSKE